MRKDNPNKVKVIFEENDFPYFQDHGFYRGIPAGVEFQVDSWELATAHLIGAGPNQYRIEVNQGSLWLSAPGYGLEPYGSGPIAIQPSTIFKRGTIL